MKKIIRQGLQNVQILQDQLIECKTDLEVLDVYQRLHVMMWCVLQDVLKEYGEREGEGNHDQ